MIIDMAFVEFLMGWSSLRGKSFKINIMSCLKITHICSYTNTEFNRSVKLYHMNSSMKWPKV